MQNKIEKSDNGTTQRYAHQELSTLTSFQKMYEQAWKVGDVATVAALTSAAILVVQGPIRTLMLRSLKKTTHATQTQESLHLKGGMLSFINGLNRLYYGSAASATSSVARTAYTTTTKNSKTSSEPLTKEGGAIEDTAAHVNASFLDVLTAACGERFIIQGPETLVALKKAEQLPKDFTWRTRHNMLKLMTNGISPALIASGIGYGAMLALQPQIADRLPVKNNAQRNALAGGISGALSAIPATPFALLKDHITLQSTVKQGKLETKGTLEIIDVLAKKVAGDPKSVLKEFRGILLKQTPPKMVLTATIFGIVSSANELFGQAPLEKIIPKRFHPHRTPQAPRPSQVPQTLFTGSAASKDASAPSIDVKP